jgi:hypothetical protein
MVFFSVKDARIVIGIISCQINTVHYSTPPDFMKFYELEDPVEGSESDKL